MHRDNLNRIQVKVKKLYNHSKIPEYQTSGSAGLDLMAAIEEEIIIQPLQRVLIPTGIAMEIPSGYEGQVRPRSGLALKHGITCLNTPGTIDSDYRGEIKVILINLGDTSYIIQPYDRVAQLVLSPIVMAELQVVTTLDETIRDKKGFGHTGKKSV